MSVLLRKMTWIIEALNLGGLVWLGVWLQRKQCSDCLLNDLRYWAEKYWDIANGWQRFTLKASLKKFALGLVLESMSNPEQAMLQVHVSFPSGCGETLALPQNSTVGELKVLVPKSFRQGFLKLVTEKGHALTNPEDSLLTAGIQEGARLTVVAQ